MGLDIYFCSGTDGKLPVWRNSVVFHNRYWIKRWIYRTLGISDINEETADTDRATLAELVRTIDAVLACPIKAAELLPPCEDDHGGPDYFEYYLQQLKEARTLLTKFIEATDPESPIHFGAATDKERRHEYAYE